MSALEPTVLEAVEWAERMAPGSGQGAYLSTLARAARASLEPATAELISEPQIEASWLIAAQLLAAAGTTLDVADALKRLPVLATQIRAKMEASAE